MAEAALAEATVRLAELVRRARSEDRDVLLEHELLPLLPALGVSVPRHRLLPPEPADAAIADACRELGTELVVVKVQAPAIVHKSAAGGVAIVPRDAVGSAIRSMAFEDVHGYLVSEHVEHERELLVGMRHAADVGPVVAVGPGGVQANDLARMLRPEHAGSIHVAWLPHEASFAPLSKWLAAAERWCPRLLSELEVNPVALTDGGPIALDAFARIAAPKRSPLPLPRPRAHMARLLQPERIALVGVSTRHDNPGRTILHNLLADGFDRTRIWVVKPGIADVEGCPAVPDVASLPEPVDLLVLAIAADGVTAVVEGAIAAGRAHAILIVPGGMGEHPHGRDIDTHLRELVAEARSRDPDGCPILAGGNCLGIQSRPGGYDTTFVPRRKMPTLTEDAPLAIISQSGAMLVSLGSQLAPRRPRYAISVGNQLDVTLGDHLAFLAEDDDTQVFACYVEGFRPMDGRRWLEAAARIRASGRAVLLHRAGRTSDGARATASHTAAVAGDTRITDALAAQAGALVTHSLDDFADLIRLSLALRDRRVGNGLGALSNAGFECVAIADHVGSLQLVQPSASTRTELGNILEAHGLGDIVTVRNPLDVNPMLDDEGFARAARTLLADERVDVGVIGCVPMTGALRTLPEEWDEAGVVDGLVELWRDTDKAWVAVVAAGATYDPMVAFLERGGVPVFRSADRAARLLEAYARWRGVTRTDP